MSSRPDPDLPLASTDWKRLPKPTDCHGHVRGAGTFYYCQEA